MLRRSKRRPSPEELVIPDDIQEARSVRAATQRDRHVFERRAPFLDLMANVIIDRHGQNHYIELLYSYSPRSNT